MAEVTVAGYQSIRNFIEATWKFIELCDHNGDPVLRLSPADQRVSWTHQAGAQVLELTVVLQGSDADVPLGTTFTGSAIFSVAAGGSALSGESFTPFTMAETEDQLTIRHLLEVPKVQES